MSDKNKFGIANFIADNMGSNLLIDFPKAQQDKYKGPWLDKFFQLVREPRYYIIWCIIEIILIIKFL